MGAIASLIAELCTCEWYFANHSEFCVMIYQKFEVSKIEFKCLPKCFSKSFPPTSWPKFVFLFQSISKLYKEFQCYWQYVIDPKSDRFYASPAACVICVRPSFLPCQFCISNSISIMHHHSFHAPSNLMSSGMRFAFFSVATRMFSLFKIMSCLFNF